MKIILGDFELYGLKHVRSVSGSVYCVTLVQNVIMPDGPFFVELFSICDTKYDVFAEIEIGDYTRANIYSENPLGLVDHRLWSEMKETYGEALALYTTTIESLSLLCP